jgi:hypothetical protein
MHPGDLPTFELSPEPRDPSSALIGQVGQRAGPVRLDPKVDGGGKVFQELLERRQRRPGHVEHVQGCLMRRRPASVQQVAAPAGTAIAENDAAMPLHWGDATPYRSLADLMAPSRADL